MVIWFWWDHPASNSKAENPLPMGVEQTVNFLYSRTSKVCISKHFSHRRLRARIIEREREREREREKEDKDRLLRGLVGSPRERFEG